MSINNEQVKLVNEIYTREGSVAVLKYLTEHEGMKLHEAKQWIVSLGFKDNSCMDCKVEPERTEFEHYCLFDDVVFIGPDGALCPKCKTDGYNKPTGVKAIPFFFRTLFSNKQIA